MRIQKCRMCSSKDLEKFLDLGHHPPSDNFLTQEQLDNPEIFYPLDVLICKKCGLWQLGYVVPPELMFNENYPYVSSTTTTGKTHYISMANNICRKFNLLKNDLAVDIGSNVGVLLSGFNSNGLRVLGIEPSKNVAKIAQKNKINTLIAFFSSKLARQILRKHGKVSVITGTNVFAHINNLNDFFKAVDILLTKNGILVIEAPYLVNLIENLEYDTIYHEHLSYISLKPLIQFCKLHGFVVFDVEMQSIHGGTMRYYISRKDAQKPTKNIKYYLNLEKQKKIYSKKTLVNFSREINNQRQELNRLLFNLKLKGKKIVGLSAPAKGNTLLNYCKLGPEILDYVTEKAPLKIGKFTPGTHIPIFHDKKLLKDKPDYALILAWNFSKEIIKNNKKFKESGGRFIIPIPKPKII